MKKLLLVLVVLAVVVAGGIFWAYHSVDLLVKVAVEHYAPDVAGVSVKVGEVQISARDGRGAVRDVVIGNPPWVRVHRIPSAARTTLRRDYVSFRSAAWRARRRARLRLRHRRLARDSPGLANTSCVLPCSSVNRRCPSVRMTTTPPG